MSDGTAEIIRMANQIADFFRSYPEPEAEVGVEHHIRDFWDPRMRRELAHVLESRGAELSDLARAGAVRVFREPEPAPPSPGCDAG